MYALLYVQQTRQHLSPLNANAACAAYAAMMAAALAGDVLINAALGVSYHQGARRGAAALKTKRRRRATQRHKKLRAKAATLSPKLSAASKAEFLARTFKLSASRIRHIIKK
jgi:hypothetical protein